MDTLLDRVLFYPTLDCNKHCLAENTEQYVRDHINEMSNLELVEVLSLALEEVLEARMTDSKPIFTALAICQRCRSGEMEK
jgi:hypothetical protein